MPASFLISLSNPSLFFQAFLGFNSSEGTPSNNGRDREIEGSEVLVLGLGEFTGVDGVDDATSELERTPGTGSILATSPTSVDEPAVDLVLGHALRPTSLRTFQAIGNNPVCQRGLDVRE
jgi:hypothetical protein